MPSTVLGIEAIVASNRFKHLPCGADNSRGPRLKAIWSGSSPCVGLVKGPSLLPSSRCHGVPLNFPSSVPPGKKPEAHTPGGGLPRLHHGQPLLLDAALSFLADEGPAPAQGPLDLAAAPDPLQPLLHPHSGQYPYWHGGGQGMGSVSCALTVCCRGYASRLRASVSHRIVTGRADSEVRWPGVGSHLLQVLAGGSFRCFLPCFCALLPSAGRTGPPLMARREEHSACEALGSVPGAQGGRSVPGARHVSNSPLGPASSQAWRWCLSVEAG